MAILQSRNVVAPVRGDRRFVMSIAAAMLAGTALAPSHAQVADLGGGTIVTNDFLTFSPAVFAGLPAEITNGTLRAITPGAIAVIFGGNLTDSLGVLALRKEGTGALTLTGVNTHSGTTAALNGTLIAGSGTALSAASLLAIGSGVGTAATVDLNGFNSSVAGLSGNFRGTLTSTTGPAVLTITSDVNRSFGGSLQGQVGITKRGTSVLTFSYGDPIGNASSATGPITLEAGGIRVAGVNALGSGTMTVTGAATFANFGTAPTTFNNNIVLDAALTLSARSATVFTVGGAISGTGALSLAPSGTLQLLGNNSYSGGTVFIGGGRTELGSSTAFGTGSVAINGSTILALFDPGVGVTLANDISIGTQPLRVELGNIGTVFGFSGAISGARDIVVTGGDGTLLLSGDNSAHTGVTRINSGTLALATSASTGTGAIRLASGTSVVTTAAIDISSNIVGSGDTISTTIDTGAFNSSISGALRNGTAPVDSMTVSKIGSGILTLSNAATGTSTRNAVTELQVAEGGLNLLGGFAGDLTVASGAALAGVGTQFVGTTTLQSGSTLAAGNALAGPAVVGTLTLANLTLAGGTTSNFDLGAVGASDLVVVTGNLNLAGTLNINTLTGFGVGTYTLFNYGGAATGGLLLGALPVGYDYSLAVGGGNVDLIVQLLDYYWDGNGPAGNGIVNGGPGVWNAAGTNWTDISGTASEPWAAGARAFFTNIGGEVSLADSISYELLRFEADAYVINPAADGAALTATAGVIDVTAGNTATVNAELAGTGGLSKIGAGTLVLGGTNSVTGGISITDGTLAVTSAAALGPDAVTVTGAGRTLRFDADMTVANNINGVGIAYRIDTSGNDVVLNGSLSGGGADKVGSGTLVLNNAINAQPDAINILAGSLIVNGGVQGDALVQLGAVLGGTGTVTGSVLASGTISAGTAPGLAGTLTLGALTLFAPSVSLFDLGAINVVGASNDLLQVNGGLTLDGTLNVNPLSGWNIGTGSHRLFNYTGALSNNGLELGGILSTPPADVTYAVDTTVAGQVNLTVAYGGAFNWDGAGAPVDGVIEGGNGTWDGAGTNWTNSDGLFNLAYVDSNATVVNFGGVDAGGTVDVVGTRSFGTMNFLADDFVLSGDGNLAVDGATINVAADATATIAIAINGSGTLNKTGAGTLDLTGTSGFGGAVVANAGTLVISGSFTNAAATLNAVNGAVITGTGTFAGTAILANGSILSPGGSPGLLTLGNLILSDGTIRNFEYGAANTLGGPLNDRVVVTGDLLLDGILNVTESAGGAFTAGIYNMYTYGTLLGDNGVIVNALPNGLAGSVQINTSANQVNLIVTQTGSIVLNWDGADFAGTPSGPQGGAGVWNAANTNWTGLPPGEINASWQNNAVAIFGAPGGAVDVADAIQFGGIGFQAAGYTLGGAGSLGTNAAAGSFVSVDDGLTATINTVVTGSGVLRKQGGGTLVLGGANTNSGGVSLQAGAITITNEASLGTGALTTTGPATTLNVGVTASNQTITLANSISLGAGTLTVDLRGTSLAQTADGSFITDGNSLVVNGIVGGTGGLRVANSGTLTLNAANSYSGGTNVANRALILVGNNRALGTGAVTFGFETGLRNNSGATVSLDNNIVLNGSGGFVTLGGSHNLVLNGVVSGSASPLFKVGNATLTLNGANTHTANTNLLRGTIAAGTSSALGTGQLTMSDGTTLAAGANGLNLANAILTTGVGTVDTGANNLTLSGLISGGGSVRKIGAGSLTLTQANSYSGGTALQDGVISVANSSALGTDALTMTGGTLLQEAVGGLTLANSISLLAGSAFISTDRSLTLSGVISGTGQLIKAGVGNLIITNANSHGGGTRIDSGTVTVANNLALSTGQLVMQAGSTLASGAAGLALLNNITLLGGGTVDTAANSFTLGGVIDGATGALTKIGSGILILSGTNTYGGGTNLNAGTLTVTNNSAIGTGALAMADGTTLSAGGSTIVLANAISTAGLGTINTANNLLTLDGVISGVGSIAKTGSGTLVLNAANLYAGGTALNAGSIRIGNNNGLGTGALAMAAGTTLQAGVSGLVVANAIGLAGGGVVDVNGTEFALSGVISGSGPLSVIDSVGGTTGVLTLSGANDYTGGTIVTGTSLRVASDTNLGAAADGVTLNGGTLWTTANLTTSRAIALGVGGGTLRVAPDTTLTVAGVIGGSSLAKSGTGTLVLNSANTHTGGTALTAGTIIVNNSAALGTGTLTATGGTVLAAGTSGLTLGNGVNVLTGALTIDSGATPAALTMSGVISGDGGLTKVNTGLLNLTGASSYTGATTVSAGTLNVTGSLASAVTVNSGAALNGSGTVGALSVVAGGLVNPGAVGTANAATLTVTGAATLLGTYTANVTALGADRITAGGPLTLGGTLAVAPTPGFTQFNQSFTVASGSTRTGTFGTVTGLAGFGAMFNPLVEYTATAANIRMAPQSLITLLAGSGTANAREVASGFDRAVAQGYNPQAFFNVYASGAALPTTLLQMSGEQRATERRVVLDTGRVFRETALDRLNLGLAAMAGQQVQTGDADTGSVTFFLRGAGSWGSSDTSGAATGFRTEQRGLLTGIDWAKDGLTIGTMFHYTSTDIEYRVLGGSSNVETTGGTFYAGYRRDGGVVANAGVSVAGARTNGARAITLPGFAQTLQGRTIGTTYQVFGELAYDLAGGANARIEPFARLTYVQADMQSLNETGAIAALAAPKQSYDIAVTNLGLRVGTVTAGGKVSMNASAAWQRTSGAREATTAIGIPVVGQLGQIQSVAMDPDAALLQADIGFNLSDTARINVGYSGLIGRNNDDHGGRATLSFAF